MTLLRWRQLPTKGKQESHRLGLFRVCLEAILALISRWKHTELLFSSSRSYTGTSSLSNSEKTSVFEGFKAKQHRITRGCGLALSILTLFDCRHTHKWCNIWQRLLRKVAVLKPEKPQRYHYRLTICRILKDLHHVWWISAAEMTCSSQRNLVVASIIISKGQVEICRRMLKLDAIKRSFPLFCRE